MRRALPWALLGAGLYGLLAFALDRRLPALPDALGLLLAAGLFSVLAVTALALGTRARLPRNTAALAGLVLLAATVAVSGHPPLHAALLLASAIALGDAFSDWVTPRLRDLSVIFTTAVCLALFDVWSVTLGPAHSATSGGFLSRLLLDAPAPSGWIHFLGISDLVIVVLLEGVIARRGKRPTRALLAGLLGILASLGQAYLTRRPAPALPWIGAFFAALAWPLVRPDRAGWLRTAKWSGITVAVLAAATAARFAMRCYWPTTIGCCWAWSTAAVKRTKSAYDSGETRPCFTSAYSSRTRVLPSSFAARLKVPNGPVMFAGCPRSTAFMPAGSSMRTSVTELSLPLMSSGVVRLASET